MSADYLFFPLVESPLSSCTPVCVCVWVYSRDALFPGPPEWIQFFSERITRRCLLVGFPRLKGKTNLYLFFLFDCLVALIVAYLTTVSLGKQSN
jgi:hypothetical protein